MQLILTLKENLLVVRLLYIVTINCLWFGSRRIFSQLLHLWNNFCNDPRGFTSVCKGCNWHFSRSSWLLRSQCILRAVSVYEVPWGLILVYLSNSFHSLLRWDGRFVCHLKLLLTSNTSCHYFRLRWRLVQNVTCKKLHVQVTLILKIGMMFGAKIICQQAQIFATVQCLDLIVVLSAQLRCRV